MAGKPEWLTRRRAVMGLLGLGAWVAVILLSQPGATPAAPAAAAPATPATAPLTTAVDNTTRSLGKQDPLPSNLGVKDQQLSRLLWESLAAVLVILVLGGIGVYVVRRVMPRITAARGKQITLLESFHLAPQRTVHLLQVGQRSLLVGASREGLSLLADVTGDLGEEDATPAAETPRKKFVLPTLADDAGDAGSGAPQS